MPPVSVCNKNKNLTQCKLLKSYSCDLLRQNMPSVCLTHLLSIFIPQIFTYVTTPSQETESTSLSALISLPPTIHRHIRPQLLSPVLSSPPSALSDLSGSIPVLEKAENSREQADGQRLPRGFLTLCLSPSPSHQISISCRSCDCFTPVALHFSH